MLSILNFGKHFWISLSNLLIFLMGEHNSSVFYLKLLRRNTGLLWRQQVVECAHFNTSREVDDLITEVEVSNKDS